ncbi:hypothetical protein CRI70_08640 [Streptomyces sp. Ru87]|nr:hypothetical protein CRI70_08640 [Streptomyces sp. Ru87]
MTFGTLLSSQRTDASFEPVSGPSGRFPSVFPTLPDAFRPEFPADPQFQPPVGEGLCCAFRRGHYFSGFPPQLIIECTGIEFGHAEKDPAGGIVAVVVLPLPDIDLPGSSGSGYVRRSTGESQVASAVPLFPRRRGTWAR